MGVLATMLFYACSSSSTDAVETEEAGEAAEATVESVTYQIDPEATTLGWYGEKITGDFHKGTIKVSEGSLSLEGDSITAGSFVVDMNTIDETDPSSEGGEAKLVGHLKSGDFFLVDSFPTAEFVVTGHNGSDVSGNLTIRGITKEVTIPTTVTKSETGLNVSSEFAIDRSQWDVKFRSGAFYDDLGDKLIKDDIKFTLNLALKQ